MLALTVAAEVAIPVAYVTGLVMRRTADLYAGAVERPTPRTQVLADFAWRDADRLTWTTVTSLLLTCLGILNGRDTDLAGDATKAANRLRRACFARIAGSGTCHSRTGWGSVPGLRAALMWLNPSALRAVGRLAKREW